MLNGLEKMDEAGLGNESVDPGQDDSYTSRLSHEGDIWAGVYLVFISTIAFLGNLSVMIIFLRKREKLKPLDLLTINLAVGDFLICIFSYPLPTISAFRHEWSFGRIGCIWYGFTGFLFAVVSMATLTVIALFRYVKLCRKNVEKYQSRSFIFKVIGAIWVFSVFITVPPLFGWSRYVPEPYHLSCTVNFTDTSPAGMAYTYFIMIMAFFLPLTIIVTCYALIARKIIHHNRRINVGHNAGRMLLEIRLLKTACAITLAYTISWTPYALIAMWISFQPVVQIPDAFRILPAFCAKTASVYNPIIYCIFNKSFRRDLNSLMCCCACQCYTVSINVDVNRHAQRQLRRTETKRHQVGSSGRPVLVCGNPFTWQLDVKEQWRTRRRFRRNIGNNSRVENINVHFRVDKNEADVDISTAELPRERELNTAGRRAHRKSLTSNLPVLEENPTDGDHAPSEFQNVYMPGTLEVTPLQHQQPGTSERREELLTPNLVSRNMCVIMVKPNIEEELSSD